MNLRGKQFNLSRAQQFCVRFLFIGFLLLNSCGTSSQNSDPQLLQKIKINVPEPSGLTIANGFLYTISDANGSVYKLSLDGKLLKTYKTKLKGLEGITFNPNTFTFYLISESKRKMYQFDLKKGVLDSKKIKGKQNGGNNKGLEGICYNSKNHSFYVVNEYKPKQLLKLTQKGKIHEKYRLDFADDISGICYEEKENVFWILSDESKMIYKTNTKGKLLKKYKLPITKAEGIVIYNGRMYVVSDATSELFIFQL